MTRSSGERAARALRPDPSHPGGARRGSSRRLGGFHPRGSPLGPDDSRLSRHRDDTAAGTRARRPPRGGTPRPLRLVRTDLSGKPESRPRLSLPSESPLPRPPFAPPPRSRPLGSLSLPPHRGGGANGGRGSGDSRGRDRRGRDSG